MSRPGTAFVLAGLIAVAGVALAGATSLRVAHADSLVPICHHAGPTRTMTLNVSPSAVQPHVMSHGDTVGACGSGGGTPS